MVQKLRLEYLIGWCRTMTFQTHTFIWILIFRGIKAFWNTGCLFPYIFSAPYVVEFCSVFIIVCYFWKSNLSSRTVLTVYLDQRSTDGISVQVVGCLMQLLCFISGGNCVNRWLCKNMPFLMLYLSVLFTFQISSLKPQSCKYKCICITQYKQSVAVYSCLELSCLVLAQPSTFNETPQLWGRKSKAVGWFLLHFCPVAIWKHDGVPLWQNTEMFRACQVKQSLWLPTWLSWLALGPLCYFSAALRKGWECCILNLLVNSSGQRFVWLCICIWGGDTLPCRNVQGWLGD